MLPAVPRRLPRFARTLYAGTDSATQRVIDAAKSIRTPRAPTTSHPGISERDLKSAVAATVTSKNGYQAWSLYTALRQGHHPLSPEVVEDLAGTMLHVDHELHAELAARRTLLVIDAERQSGRHPSLKLLMHGAAACGLQGLPSLADRLRAEAEQSGGQPQGHEVLEMRASLIRAYGIASEISKAFEVYRQMEQVTGRRPPTSSAAIALVAACVSAGKLDLAFEVLDEVVRSQHITASRRHARPVALCTHSFTLLFVFLSASVFAAHLWLPCSGWHLGTYPSWLYPLRRACKGA